MKKRLTTKILYALGIPGVFLPGLILASILGWNWQKDLARLSAQGGFYQSEVLFPKKAMVNKVIDGDTMELENGRIVRLVGVDAPDRGQDFYEEALEFSQKMIEGKTVGLEYDRYQDDKFGRILAYIFPERDVGDVRGLGEKSKMLNIRLVEEGLAKVVIYKDRAKLEYQEELIKAEEKAKEEGKGVWKESN